MENASAENLPSERLTGIARDDAGHSGRASDARLCDEVAVRVARPKEAPADSFVLHAPLELLARTALLPLVRPDLHDPARERLVAFGAQYAAAGDEIGEPAERRYENPARAARDLVAAIAAGEFDDADAAAAWLAARLDAESLVRVLADDVLPRLAAAAHGSIFLFHLPRVAPRSAAIARTLRGLVRELVRERDWHLGWFRAAAPSPRGTSVALDPNDGDPRAAAAAAATLTERLLAPPSPGDPGSPFIYPTMRIVETSGLAAQILRGPANALDVATASRTLARVAAWSMLQDEPAVAPYGWSHTLTMPQATLGIAHACHDPHAAIAVAATYVLGFRATLGRVRLDPAWIPARATASDPLAALEGTPAEAASAAWHAARDDRPMVIEALATRASLHHDAHLVKYTLACLDASRADPEAGTLYLAAAAYLSAWWRVADAAA
jgi:hypothetical protein